MDEPKNFEGQMMPGYTPIETGQTIMIFQTPPEMVEHMNAHADDLISQGKLEQMNLDGMGKIGKKYSLYCDDDEYAGAENHNFIPDDIHEWIKDRIHQYLQLKRVEYAGIKTNVAWINDFGADDYLPTHIHAGARGTYNWNPGKPHQEGLIGMMALNMPKDMENKELSKSHPISYRYFDKSGYIEFSTGNHPRLQFAINSYPILQKTGDFIVFPYDMFHAVYPHFNQTEIRRTMPTNIDVFINY